MKVWIYSGYFWLCVGPNLWFPERVPSCRHPLPCFERRVISGKYIWFKVEIRCTAWKINIGNYVNTSQCKL